MRLKSYWLVEAFYDGLWHSYLRCLRQQSAYAAAERIASCGDTARVSWVGEK